MQPPPRRGASRERAASTHGRDARHRRGPLQYALHSASSEPERHRARNRGGPHPCKKLHRALSESWQRPNATNSDSVESQSYYHRCATRRSATSRNHRYTNIATNVNGTTTRTVHRRTVRLSLPTSTTQRPSRMHTARCNVDSVTRNGHHRLLDPSMGQYDGNSGNATTSTSELGQRIRWVDKGKWRENDEYRYVNK